MSEVFVDKTVRYEIVMKLTSDEYHILLSALNSWIGTSNAATKPEYTHMAGEIFEQLKSLR